MREEHRQDRRAFERRAPGDHLVHHDAERVDIGANVHQAALALLRRHVLRAAQEKPGERQVLLTAFGNVLHEPEVEHLDEVRLVHVVDEVDVRRLEIAVDDARGVCLAQRAGNLPRDPHGAVLGEMARLTNRGRERLPVQVLHRDVRDSVVDFAEIEDGHRVGVTQLRHRARLAKQPLAKNVIPRARLARVGGIAHIEDLEGADSPERRLHRAVHPGHTPARDQAKHSVLAGDDASEERVARAERLKARSGRRDCVFPRLMRNRAIVNLADPGFGDFSAYMARGRAHPRAGAGLGPPRPLRICAFRWLAGRARRVNWWLPRHDAFLKGTRRSQTDQ